MVGVIAAEIDRLAVGLAEGRKGIGVNRHEFRLAWLVSAVHLAHAPATLSVAQRIHGAGVETALLVALVMRREVLRAEPRWSDGNEGFETDQVQQLVRLEIAQRHEGVVGAQYKRDGGAFEMAADLAPKGRIGARGVWS